MSVVSETNRWKVIVFWVVSMVALMFFIPSESKAESGLCDVFIALDSDGNKVEIPETADENYEKIYLATIKALNGKYDGVCKDIVYGIIAKSAYYANSVYWKVYGKHLISENIGDFVLLLGAKGGSSLQLFSKSLSLNDVVEHIVDIAADVTITMVSNEVKDSRYKKPTEWWMKNAYTDVKGAILFALAGGNWGAQIEAGAGVVIGNLEVLVDIANEDWKLAVELVDERGNLRRAKKLSEILSLYMVKSEQYFKDINEDKDKIYESFFEDCKKVSSILDKDWTLEKCRKYRRDMAQTEMLKSERLIDLLNYGSESSYFDYVDKLYPSISADVLKSSYGVAKNYFGFSDVKGDIFVEKYLIISSAYGINIKGNNGRFNANDFISNVEALAFLHRSFYSSDDEVFKGNKDLSKYFQEFKRIDRSFFDDTSINSNNLGVCDEENLENCISRDDFAVLLVKVLGFDEELNFSAGWGKYSQVLKNNRIVDGFSGEGFKGHLKIKRGGFIKMLALSMVSIKCGYVNIDPNFNNIGCEWKPKVY